MQGTSGMQNIKFETETYTLTLVLLIHVSQSKETKRLYLYYEFFNLKQTVTRGKYLYFLILITVPTSCS